MKGRRLVILGLLVGCAGAAPEVSAPEPASSAGAEAPPLTGRWAEYWSVAGDVPTEQHVFEGDGRWSWRAGPGSEDPSLVRAGRWRMEGDALVLTVESEAGDVVASPFEERVELGVCPPNDEARVMDAAYECRSFAGRAFWRRPQ